MSYACQRPGTFPGLPFDITLANHDMSGTDGWSCVPLEEAVAAAKWTYYVTKTLLHLGELLAEG